VESLPCTAGQWAGQSFRLRPWQKRELRRIYRTDTDGRRIVRTVCWSMGRGNGKSGLAAVLALCHLCGPEAQQRGEIYVAANDRFQAGRLFSEVAAILGDILSTEHVRRLAKQAQNVPSAESSFRNHVLNQRVATSNAFIAPSVWTACNGAVDSEALANGIEIYAGLDLSAVADLTT